VSANLNTMIDAIKYASQYIRNSDNNIEMLLTSLKDYGIVNKVITNILPNTVITAPSIQITNPTKEDFISIDSVNWDSYFAKKDDILKTNVSFNVSVYDEKKDNTFLTKEIVKEYSVINEGKIEAKELFYDDKVEFDINKDVLNNGSVLSYKEAELLALPKDKDLKINKLNAWDIVINIINTKITNAKTSYLKIDNILAFNNRLSLKKISFPNGQYSKKKLKENYIKDDYRIDKYATVPKEAEHNILLMEDVFFPNKEKNLPLYKKTNDSVRIIMDEEQSFDIISESIDENIVNNNELFFEDKNYLIQKRNLQQTISKIISSYQI
jgi:hypothetical protein